MNNTVYDIDFTRALPDPLKDDENILALGRAIAGELQENIRLSRLAIIYARIDELDENILDILARDLHVDWYEDTYPVDAKRQVIKDSVKVHKRLGTKYAMTTALGSVFPHTEVQEWYEYGGTHHRFRIILDFTNAKAPADIFQVLRTQQFYKRLTAHLDEVIVQMSAVVGTPGARIHKDTRLGIMGTTGTYSTGVHLHTEMRQYTPGEDFILSPFGTNSFKQSTVAKWFDPLKAIFIKTSAPDNQIYKTTNDNYINEDNKTAKALK